MLASFPCTTPNASFAFGQPLLSDGFFCDGFIQHVDLPALVPSQLALPATAFIAMHQDSASKTYTRPPGTRSLFLFQNNLGNFPCSFPVGLTQHARAPELSSAGSTPARSATCWPTHLPGAPHAPPCRALYAAATRPVLTRTRASQDCSTDRFRPIRHRRLYVFRLICLPCFPIASAVQFRC